MTPFSSSPYRAQFPTVTNMTLSATPTTDVPRPTCRRCEDWTTVIHKNNTLSPCPACRPAGFKAWLADGNKIPDREMAE